VSEQFERQLHPELRRRIGYVVQDLMDRGWNPIIPEVYGPEGTGYRSFNDQLRLRREHPERTGVRYSFHNVTEPLTFGPTQATAPLQFQMQSFSTSLLARRPTFGPFALRPPTEIPGSMAVHVIDRNLGQNLPPGHSFWQDLQTSSQRHGLQTGNSWTTPWDPAHVQLYDNSALRRVSWGERPAYPQARLQLWAPSLSLRPQPSYTPPRSIENFMAGERFQLQMGMQTRTAQPSLGNFQLRPPSL
jgi:hypothetical protein